MWERTLLANNEAKVGSNAFLSTLMNGLSLCCCESDFAVRLSFDLAIATNELRLAMDEVRKFWVGLHTCGSVLAGLVGGEGVQD